MAAAGAACASALMFARFVTPDALEADVTRAIEPKLLFDFVTADAPLAAGLRPILAAAAEDVRADVFTAALRALLALVAAARGAASALMLLPVTDVTAWAGTTL